MLLKTPKYDKDEYSQMVEVGVETEELEDALCQAEKEVVWTTSKHN